MPGTEWKQSLSEDIRNNNNYKKIISLLEETFNTEATFIQNTNKLNQSLQAFQPQGTEEYVSIANNHKAAVSNLAQSQANLGFHDLLRTNPNPEALVRAIQEKINSPSFQEYTDAISNLTLNYTAYNISYNELSNGPTFQAEFSLQNKNAGSRQISLGSFLIEPVQRLPRFSLLFRDLSTSAKKIGLEEIQNTATEMVETINQTNADLNEKTRAYEPIVKQQIADAAQFKAAEMAAEAAAKSFADAASTKKNGFRGSIGKVNEKVQDIKKDVKFMTKGAKKELKKNASLIATDIKKEASNLFKNFKSQFNKVKRSKEANSAKEVENEIRQDSPKIR